MKYRVKLKNIGTAKTIKASSELEARAKYCEERGFNYRVFANKLEIEPKSKPRRKKALL